MNVFEFHRKLNLLSNAVIAEIGVKSVRENEEVVVSDATVANIEGFTFAGNKIEKYPPFSDWEESGQFHENLKFGNGIEFTSFGDGAESIFQVFPDNDTIAPSAKILDKSTMELIRQSFINNLNTLIFK